MADLHLTSERATSAEAEAIDAAMASLGVDRAVVHETERLVLGGVHRRNERRHALLPALHALQNHSGWITPGGINYIAEVLDVPPAEGFGVASFYEMFRMEDPGHTENVVHVCVDSPCLGAGADEVVVSLEAGGSHVHRSPCLGQCERAPAQFIQGCGAPDVVPADVEASDPVIPQQYDPSLRLLRRIGRHDPASLESYVGVGGYKALAAAFAMGADEVIRNVDVAGLKGRGGAAFPTGFKWKAVQEAIGDQKYVVVNADESEPGTFKDRVVMENDPFALIEAATIAGFAVGATKGYIYIRGEYPLATARLEDAIAEAASGGFLGADIAGSGIEFNIEVRRGAGAYICGEETALFNSLEGFRGEPRQKPPFPTTNGLFDSPTAINNPETLINVLDIVTDGGEAYKELGTAGSDGTKLFCLSGHVAVPGLYEVEFGASLGEMIELAGGVTGGEVKAVLLGGAAGSFAGPELLAMPLTFEATRAEGQSLGSGVIIVFNDATNFDPIVQRIAEFFRNESCGQCVPCRIGVVRQHEILVKASGRTLNGEVKLLEDIDLAMKDASICGLGHTAATAVRSAISLGLMGT